jgi:hypothetical protein
MMSSRVGATARRRGAPALASWTALLIAAVWIWSGSQKLTHPDAFVETVRVHRVVPEVFVAWAVALGPVEAGLGLALAMTATGSPRRTHVFTLSASVALTLCLTCYLLQIPDAVLASSGCGCHGIMRVSAWPRSATMSRAAALTLNGALLAMHVPLVRRLPSAHEVVR